MAVGVRVEGQVRRPATLGTASGAASAAVGNAAMPSMAALRPARRDGRDGG